MSDLNSHRFNELIRQEQNINKSLKNSYFNQVKSLDEQRGLKSRNNLRRDFNIDTLISSLDQLIIDPALLYLQI